MKKFVKNWGSAKIIEGYMKTLRIPYWRLRANEYEGKKKAAMVKPQGQRSLLLGAAFQKHPSKTWIWG